MSVDRSVLLGADGGNVEHLPASPSPVDDTATVVRSEEQLTVSLPVRVRAGLRVKKIVRAETLTQTVQIRREHLLVEELSADDLTAGTDTDQHISYAQLADRDFEMVEHEERIVLNTQVVPVERVRIGIRVVTDRVEVSDSVRREEVEVLDPADVAAGGPAGAKRVPLHQAELVDGQVVVPYRLDVILNAPGIPVDRFLTPHEEDALFDYYGVPVDGVIPAVAHLGQVMTTDTEHGVTSTSTNTN